MSNIFKGTSCYYFQLPQQLVRQGILHQMDGCELKLYVALLYEAQRRSRTDFTYLNAELKLLTGLSDGSIAKARLQLSKRGLLRCNRGLGGAYAYQLCIPEDGMADEEDLLPSSSQKQKPLSSLSRSQYESYYRTHLESVRYTPSGLQAICPFHADSKPSLFVKLDNGCWYCHGCAEGGTVLKFEYKRNPQQSAESALLRIEQILGLTGLVATEGQEPEAIYQYRDSSERVTYEVLRLPDKKFLQRQWKDDRWVYNAKGQPRLLYCLPEVLKASHVIVCEGEKDADHLNSIDWLSLAGLSVTATTNPNGAGKWRKQYSDYLIGKSVVILPDMDEAGLSHAHTIQKSLNGQGRIVLLPEELSDVTEFLEERTEKQLVDLIGEDWFKPEVQSIPSELVEA